MCMHIRFQCQHYICTFYQDIFQGFNCSILLFHSKETSVKSHLESFWRFTERVISGRNLLIQGQVCFFPKIMSAWIHFLLCNICLVSNSFSYKTIFKKGGIKISPQDKNEPKHVQPSKLQI